MFATPLEYLAAFGIAFAVGFLCNVIFGKFIAKVKRDALRAA
jgi:hypothetical protein